jgi:hypothetical protein
MAAHLRGGAGREPHGDPHGREEIGEGAAGSAVRVARVEHVHADDRVRRDAPDLGLTFLLLAFLIALISAGQITAMRTEEADGD